MKKYFVLFLLLLTGCAYRNVLSDFNHELAETDPYVISAWYKIKKPTEPLVVYIEGTEVSKTPNVQPITNPTPTSSFLREIAARDPRANVAYIARPCQYFQTEACSVADWTTGRFSQKILDSTDTAVKKFMKKAQTDKIILVSYADGAILAGLIAVRHPQQVVHFSTLAGMLNHQQWTEFHKKEPLTDSLNLADFRTLFLTIPQQHYVGGKDTIVPPVLTQAFMQSNDHITIIPDATHDSGYQKAIQAIYQQK